MKLARKITKLIYGWWMAFARFLGFINSAILLTIVYIVVIGFMSIIVKLLRKDLLSHHVHSESFWIKKESTSHTLEQARHQF